MQLEGGGGIIKGRNQEEERKKDIKKDIKKTG
jgi:hypothetical protein